MNLRGSHNGMIELGSRGGGVDIYCLQEMAVGEGEKFYSLDGYEMIGGIGGFVKREKGSVVSMLIRECWKGKYIVLERCQWKIGIGFELKGEKRVDIWDVYLGHGKHERLEDMSGMGNVVWLGDFNVWSKRRGGEEGGRNGEGVRVKRWLNEGGLKVGNKIGEGTRYDGRSGKERVLDLAVYEGGVDLDCRMGEEVVGMDHKRLEVKVRVEDWKVEDRGWKRGKVDWKKFESELDVWGGKGIWVKEGKVRREHLEEVVGEVEEGLKERVERCKGRRGWESGR